MLNESKQQKPRFKETTPLGQHFYLIRSIRLFRVQGKG